MGCTRETAETRAVKIAAKIMQNAGLCKYDSPIKCRRLWIDEMTCEKCIKTWLMTKARKELKKEENQNELQHKA